jgi:hypothetical protein
MHSTMCVDIMQQQLHLALAVPTASSALIMDGHMEWMGSCRKQLVLLEFATFLLVYVYSFTCCSDFLLADVSWFSPSMYE